MTKINERQVIIKAVNRPGFHGKTAHLGTGTSFENDRR